MAARKTPGAGARAGAPKAAAKKATSVAGRRAGTGRDEVPAAKPPTAKRVASKPVTTVAAPPSGGVAPPTSGVAPSGGTAPSRGGASPSALAPQGAPPVLAPEIEAELRRSQAEAVATGAARPSAKAISRTLQEIAELLQLTNANTFKVRAYENAARALAGLGEELETLLDTEKLDEIPGIGSSIAEKVAMLSRTGQLPYLDELRAQVPAGLLALMRIPGLGPKKAQALHGGLGISSVEELEAASLSGRLSDLKGFGEKTAQNILLGIEQLRRVQGSFLWSFAHAVVEPIVEELRRHPAVQRIEFAGSLRRRKEIVHDVDIVLSTDDAAAVMSAFAGGAWATRVLGSGETKTSVMHPSGLQMDLRAVTDMQYPYALHHFTGSKEHNIAMRGRAIRQGIKMNEYGLFRGEVLIPCRDETEIFAAVGLAFVPPELREDSGEIEAAASGGLPARLLEPSDLRGAFHVHTTGSDGRDALEDLVAGAATLGWEYVGISDHARGTIHPDGIDATGFAAQRGAIEALRQRFPKTHILHGVEADILADGRIELDAAIAAACDFVIAGVHDAWHLDRDAQTQRLLRALEDPRTTILAHPTGRILLHRPGYEVDLLAVLEAAARHGVVVEIDSHPQRMDLDGPSARVARDKGALLCIAPDAHDVAGLAAVRYGVAMARRGWLGPEALLDTRSFEEVQAHLQRRKGRGTPPA